MVSLLHRLRDDDDLLGDARQQRSNLLRCTAALLIAEVAWAVGMLLEAAWQSEHPDGAWLKAFSVGESVASWAALATQSLKAATVRIGAALGAGDSVRVSREVAMARITAWLMGLPLTVGAAALAWPLIHSVYDLHGAAAAHALPYTLVHLVGNPFMYALAAHECVLQGLQHTVAYAAFMCWKTAYMLSSNYVAVNVMQGGPLGSGIASASRNALCALITYLYLRCRLPWLFHVHTAPSRMQVRASIRSSSSSAEHANHRYSAESTTRPWPPGPAWRSFLSDVLKLVLNRLPIVLSEVLASAVASRGGHPGADVILRRLMFVPSAIESALLTAALVVGSAYRGADDATAQLQCMRSILVGALLLGAALAAAFYPLRHAIFAAFQPSDETLAALSSDAVGFVVCASCVLGPLGAAATGICYASRAFGAVALVECLGLAAFAPAIVCVSRYAPGSLTAARGAHMLPTVVRLVGCLLLAWREGAHARQRLARAS